MPLERFSAAWREAYVREATANERAGDEHQCVFCDLLRDGVSEASGIFVATEHSFGVLNAYPYGSGHVLVLPRRHTGNLDALHDEEANDFFSLLRRTTSALQRAYSPDGMNVGFNLGRAAGAGIPQHLHAHALPRWSGDTNFMTSLAETRVLPESLVQSWQKISREI